MKKVVVGSGSAYWGDMLEPALEMAERAEVQYIGFDHLAELTMAILTRLRAKDPRAGYIPDLVPWMKALLPIAARRGIKLITNGGGANPEAAAEAVRQVAVGLGLGALRVGLVSGDDISFDIERIRKSGWKFPNLDSGEEDIDRIRDRIISANVYLGADGIRELLEAGAEVIVTGRVSDNALFVGPIMHELGWKYEPPYIDRVAAAITVGHIIECSACVTGGMSNLWRYVKRPWEVGFPIAEIDESGEATISKTPGSGGLVNEWTVKEHLLYEVHDPKRYLMPDGIADFTSLTLRDLGEDRVRVTGMSGLQRPDTLKVCFAYPDGWIGEGTVYFPWPNALEKAQWAERWVRKRLEKIGAKIEELQIDYVGLNLLHGPSAPIEDRDQGEVGLRVAGRAKTMEAADLVRREVTHLVTAGPIGTSGGVPQKVRPVVALWPSLVPRSEVKPTARMLEVRS
jgi:hypothetical protein